MQPTTTVYDAAGGATGLLALAHAWHQRVLADSVVSHAFSHGFHPDHTARLAAYWSEALGGPLEYSRQYGDESFVRRLHAGMGEHHELDERAVDCFADALADVGIHAEPLRGVLLDYFRWGTTAAMAAYPESAEDVPAGLRIPRWGWDGLVDG